MFGGTLTIDVGGNLSGQFIGLNEGSLVGNFSGIDLYITYAGGDGNDANTPSHHARRVPVAVPRSYYLSQPQR